MRGIRIVNQLPAWIIAFCLLVGSSALPAQSDVESVPKPGEADPKQEKPVDDPSGKIPAHGDFQACAGYPDQDDPGCD